MMVYNDQLYELGQIREQEYMLDATVRRSGRNRNRLQGGSLLAGAARRIRRRGQRSEA